MVKVGHDGTLWIFTVEGKDIQRELDWIKANSSLQSWQWKSPTSFVVEAPYGVELCNRLRTEGSMTVVDEAEAAVIPGEPEPHRTDVLLEVQDAMTALEREAFLHAFVTLYPQWQGAHVADILDNLLERDQHLDVTEPMHDQHGKDVQEPRLLSAAALVVYYLMGESVGNDVPWKPVFDLVHRTRAVRVAGQPGRNPIFRNVLHAMQEAEEIGGPEGEEYLQLMSNIAAEALKRRTTYFDILQEQKKRS